MKPIIRHHLYVALKSRLAEKFELLENQIPLEHTRLANHGDFSTSIALMLAKSLKISPYELAQAIKEDLLATASRSGTLFEKIEVIKPGFINFFIQTEAWHTHLSDILHQGNQYGSSLIGEKRRILVEFVSSNPTGPLHVGHGRAAAHGDIVVRLLRHLNYDVHAEYYINDAGRQVDIVSASLWLRYLEACGSKLPYFPVNAYQGNYMVTIAEAFKQTYGEQFYYPHKIHELLLKIKDEDKEKGMDSLIEQIKTTLGNEHYQTLTRFALDSILEDMKSDLTEFGVYFDQWFSEKTLIEDGSLSRTIELLKANNHTYIADGNLWFRSTSFGDDKDRVLLRASGQPTYFAVDAAYRLNIFKTRGFSQIINFLGADHHGYLARIHAVVEALGYSPKELIFNTLQLVSLYRDHQKLPLSTRSGQFITLRELREEVGNDAARLFFVLRKANQKLDFDLSLAKSQSQQNPIYYLQYAYARICSVMRQLTAKGWVWSLDEGLKTVDRLQLVEEIQLIKQLSRYPDVIIQAATQYEPYLLVQYLRELSKNFHSYYNHTPFLIEESALRNARLTLAQAIKQVLKNGFALLGIQALEMM